MQSVLPAVVRRVEIGFLHKEMPDDVGVEAPARDSDVERPMTVLTFF